MVDEATGLHIVTPAAAWSYAVMMPFPREAVGREDDSPVLAIVRAAFDAVDGDIGFGAVREDGSTYLTETIVHSLQSPAPASAELLIEDCAACAYIVVRNARDGRSSCTVRSVEVAVIEDLWETAFREPLPLRPAERWSDYYGDRADTVTEQLRRTAYSQLSAPADVPWIESLRIRLYPNNQISRVLAASGLYEPGICLVLQKLLPHAGVFVDVGANVGPFSLFAARCVGDEGAVYAFEPSSRDHARLTANIELNDLGRIVRSVRRGLGNSATRQTLRVADNANSGHNTFGKRFSDPAATLSAFEEVEICTLDDFVTGAGLDRLDVVKVDVEGFETAVLRGGRATLARFRPSLLLEVSDRQLAACESSVAELEPELLRHDYTLLSVDDGTGATRRIPSLAARTTENVVALPSGGATML